MTLRTVCAIGAALILGCDPAAAQKQRPPAADTPRDFQLPVPQRVSLENGLRLTMVPYGTVPKIWVAISVRTGNINETDAENGLSDLMGSLMKEGTTTRTAGDVARDAATMGGSVNVAVAPTQVSIDGSALSEFGPAFVELLADVVLNPAFPASEMDRLKRDMIRSLAVQRSEPQLQAMVRFNAQMFGAHPFGRPLPTDEGVNAFTMDQVKAFYAAQMGAARTHVYVVGMFDRSAIEQAVRKAFGPWKRGPDPDLPLPSPSSTRGITIIDRPGAPQSTIVMGLPVIDPSKPGYRALQVTNALLGGTFSSRITANIRESKGYTYSPYSVVDARYRSALWYEMADVSTEVTGPALKEILYEIDRLQAEAPTEEELKAIQNYYAGVFVLQNSAPAGIIGLLQHVDLHGLPDSFLTNAVKDFYAVTPEQVRDVMNQQIRDDRMAIVIVGDRAKIRSQLTPFGIILK